MLVPILLILVIEKTVNSFEQCSTVEVVKSFDPNAFSGTWYEIKRGKTMLDSLISGECTTLNFTSSSSDGVSIKLKSIVKKKANEVKGELSKAFDGSYNWAFEVPGVNCKKLSAKKITEEANNFKKS